MRSWATGPKDGRPIIIDVRSGCPDMTIASGNVVLMGGGSGYSITVKEGAHLVYWGSSCAYAEEILYLMYRGYGYAAANVYSGKRIISVCFWWTRAGVRLSPNTCSNAWSTGSSWNPGLQVGRDQWDTLDPNAPPTVFNIQTTRIDPGIFEAAP